MDPQAIKVLIVDDDVSMRSMYKRKLTYEKFVVETAVDGTDGLEKAKNFKPDIMLLDVMMPGKLSGFDVLEVLKRDDTLKTIPVIMLTNISTEEHVAKDMGVCDYLVKANTSLEDVVAKIRANVQKPQE